LGIGSRYVNLISKDNDMKRYTYFLIVLFALFSISAYAQNASKSDSTLTIFFDATDVPFGSVSVCADNLQLAEGEDFIVDYQLGVVRIINPAIVLSRKTYMITFPPVRMPQGNKTITLSNPLQVNSKEHPSLWDWEQALK